MSIAKVSDRAAEAIVARHGPLRAAEFFGRLDGAVDRFCSRHGAELVGPLSGGAVSAVMELRLRSGSRAVLKVSFDPVSAVTEAAVLRSWGSMGARRRWPLVLDVVADDGLVLLEFLDGVPAHRSPVRFGDAAAGFSEVFSVLAASSPPVVLPSASDTFAVPLLAAIDLVTRSAAAGPAYPAVLEWAFFLDAVTDVWGRLSRRPVVCAHGDLWSGNVMVSPSAQVKVFDPDPAATGVEFDVARVAADGWWGRGVVDRLEVLCAASRCDRDLAFDLLVPFAVGQVFTFLRYGWDLSPIADGVAEVAELHGAVLPHPLALPSSPRGVTL